MSFRFFPEQNVQYLGDPHKKKMENGICCSFPKFLANFHTQNVRGPGRIGRNF
jgi:hypothetical protein